MADWITGIVQHLGYLGIAFLMFLENAFPPIPSELIMPLGGFATAQGDMNFWLVVLWGSIGSAVGQLPFYYAARAMGEKRLRALVDKHGRWLMLSGRDVDRAAEWFDRHGARAVFLGRMVPGLRTLISVPAGFQRMAIVPFLLWSAAGMSIWAGVLAFVGRELGSNYGLVAKYVGPAAWVVFGIGAIVIAVWYFRRRKHRKEGRDDPQPTRRDPGRATPAQDSQSS